MLRKISVIVAFLPAGLMACSGSTADSNEDFGAIESELVGGRPALETEYSSTVMIGGCTGVKVGPKHFLLAAHCVHDYNNNTLWSSYLPGNTVFVANDHDDPFSTQRALTIQSTTMHPEWVATCDVPCGVNVLDASHAADAALIIVNEATADIATASIDASTVAAGNRVVMTGYGCENGVGQPSNVGPRMKLQAVAAQTSSALLHPGSYISTASDAADVAASYVITPGFLNDPTAASLCPGDSGGPLYRESSTELLTTGINAYYTFEDGNGVSQTNWHTRVDGSSRYSVLSWLRSLGVTVKNAPGEPITLQAEDYLPGGQNVGYSDTDVANTGGLYRPSERVDIQATTDTGGGYNVGWTAANEWLKYTFSLNAAGTYKPELRVATTTANQRIRLEVDAQSTVITLPNTGGWQTFTTVAAPNMALAAGVHNVRVFFETGGANFNWTRFTPQGSSCISPITVQAEDYATFNELTAGNSGGQYRPNEPVDIEATTDTGGGFNVGWVSAGEWLQYPLTIASASSYQAQLRVAVPSAGRKVHLEVDGVNTSGSITLPVTGGWQTWSTVSLPAQSLSAGAHTVRLVFETDGMNVNWLKVAAVSGGCP